MIPTEMPSESARPELPAEAYRSMTRTLRVGLLVAIALFLGGVLVFIAQNPALAFSQLVGSNPILSYLGLSSLASGLAAGKPEAFLTVGVLVLIATPIARVLTGAYFFGKNGEREITTVTLLVAILLLISLFVVGPLVR
ncbi:MAG: DUF1634 domain-containing protein [Thermoplasmata archaeon]